MTRRIIAEHANTAARVSKAVTPRTYRGWSIEPVYFGWQATSPNYDASWEGEEDGWIDNGEKAWGRTYDECIAEIDEWFEEHSA